MNGNQVNLDELSRYSRDFAKRIIDYYFIDHQYIEGQNILKLCDIPQVNLLVVKNLFEKWKSETSRLRSPYFDYEQEEVQNALHQFMNTLSQHIRINRDYLLPLLTDATRDSLLLVLTPRLFYQQELSKPFYQPITARKFEDIKKYIKFNKELLKSFIQKLAEESSGEISTEVAGQLLNQVYEQNKHYIEPLDWRIKNFNDIYALNIDRIYPPKGSNSQAETLVEKTQIIEAGTNKEVRKYLPNTQSLEPLGGIPKTSESTVAATSEEPSKVLNDTLADTKPDSLHEQFKNAKISSIRAAISLNQKFQYINQLFGGDSFAFNDAINRLEACKTKEDARDVMDKEYAPQFSWNLEDEEVKTFYELVERRFG